MDDSEENDELDTAHEDLMMLEQPGSIPFEDVEVLTAYVDKKLAEKVSQADLAKRIRSQALRDIYIKSVRKERMEQDEKQKKD